MLSIKPIGASSTEVSYYANLGEAENHDYYSEDGARPGLWYGNGAEQLGLSGNVDPNAFRNVLEGLSADGSERLVQQRSRGQIKRRAGFDLTFSMPKSYSVAWSQADPATRSEMDRRARFALERTLSLVEELCGRTRRGKNGAVTERAKLIFAVFSHDTARGIPGEMPDVNRHFHAVLANLSGRQDGSTGALDARPLFQRRMKMALGAMFRAELSKELEAMGFGTHRPKRERSEEKVSWFELSCVPRSLIDALSKRRAEIQTWLRKRGLTGARAAERAALRTRAGKERFTQKELFQGWRRIAAKHGFCRDSVTAEIGRRVKTEIDSASKANQAVRRAVESLAESKARFTEIELLEQAAVESQCRGLGIREIREALDTCLNASSEIVRLQDDALGTRTFTTKSMLATEKKMLQAASELSLRSVLQIPPDQVTDLFVRRSSLRGEQKEAVRAMLSGSDVACVKGIAGSGKTYMLGVAREAWEAAGFTVLGTALASKAAGGLEDGSGIRSTHIHKLLRDIEQGTMAINSHTVLVVDEAGMVGTRQMEKLVGLVSEGGGKLVLVGDWNQLQAIDAGAPFRGISETVGYTSLEEIIRQREIWARQVVRELRDGESQDALTELRNRDRLFIGEDRDEAMDRLVIDWKGLAVDGGDLRDTLVFTGTNLEVRELNRRLQGVRRENGQLGDAKIELDGLDLYVGDRILVTRNNASLCLKNGTLGAITDVQESVVTVRLDSGYSVEIDTGRFDHLTLGYALSAHKGQGVTCENALVLTGDPMTDREISYVEGSRARGITKFYSDEISTGVSLEQLAAKMNVSRQAELAYEYEIEGAA